MKLIEESCLTSLKVNTFSKCGHHLRALNSHLARLVHSRFTDGFMVGAMGFEPMMPTLWSWIQVLNLPRPKRYPTKCGALPLGHAPIIQCGFITVTTWLPQPFSLFSAVLVDERELESLRPRAAVFKTAMSTHSITRPFSLHLPKSVLQSPLRRKLCNPYTPDRQ